MRSAVVAVVVGVIACNGGIAEPPTAPPPRPLEIPLQPRAFALSNGLRVVLVADPHADVVSLLVRHDVGAIDDPPGFEGLAAVAAQAIAAQGTADATLWDELDRVATNIVMASDNDRTDFSEAFPPDALAEVLRLEARRIAPSCGAITDYWLGTTRDWVRDEIRGDDTHTLDRTIAHALYRADDRYRRGYDADPRSVARITRADVCAFLAEHYLPGNTTLVVSGPLEPASFEAAIHAALDGIPSRAVIVPPARPAPTAEVRQTITADVAEPTLVVAWPSAPDSGGRAIMDLAADALADKLDLRVYHSDDMLLLWEPHNPYGLEASLGKLRDALRAGVLSADEFERARSRKVTSLLARLDRVSTRLDVLAQGIDVTTPFRALEAVTSQGFAAAIATDFAWSRARVLELQPDGSRPIWRPASLGGRLEALRGPSVFPDAAAGPPAIRETNALRDARTFVLANGLTVVLAPTSPVPMVDIELAFPVGTSNEPADHRGTAAAAIGALLEVAQHGPHSAQAAWAIGFECSGAGMEDAGLGVIGPAMYADLLLDHFEGLATAQLTDADVRKGHDALVELASSPMHRVWDDQTALRASVYGADHPYGQPAVPGHDDVARFDAREVAAYYSKYLQPDRATLIVTGGFDPDVLTPLVHHIFDRWQGSGQRVAPTAPSGHPARLASEDQRKDVRIEIDWPRATDGAFEARLILGSMLNSISPHVHGSFAARHHGGAFRVTAVVPASTAATEVAELVRGVAVMGAGSDRSRAAFAASRRRSALDVLGGPRSAEGSARRIMFALYAGHDLAWLRSAAARLAAVSYDDVAHLATAELGPERATWLVSGPHDAVAAVYATLGIDPTWLQH